MYKALPCEIKVPESETGFLIPVVLSMIYFISLFLPVFIEKFISILLHTDVNILHCAK